jgi:fermentation-respiration switch protein FrsA (DUF1100 family)
MDKKTLKKYLVGDFTVWRLVRSAIFIYVCVLIFAAVWSDRMIFQPQPASYKDDATILKIPVANGTPISAVYLDCPEAQFTVLYNHSNAEDLGDIREFLEQYRKQGVSVFAYDYNGYGTSSGHASTRNVYKDADAALKYLMEQRGIPLNRIIIHGRSVGGGPATYLAHENRVAGLIVESTFVTAFRVLTRMPLTPFDKFRNVSRIGKVNCPVLVIHGRNDTTIPFWHGEKLFHKAREPKMNCWIDGMTHDYIPPEGEKTYWQAVASFVASLGRL